MNKYDYNDIVEEIKVLEFKLKRINFSKDLLEFTKPCFLHIKKRKVWKNKIKKLIIEEENISNYLLKKYENLEKLFT